MNKFFTYKAFGLIIQSTFVIPEFLKAEGIPVVHIKTGKVPEQLNSEAKKGVNFQATQDEFLLKIDHLANYYVNKGSEIIVEPLKEKADKEVRLFLLGSVFGALFLQRGLLPVHGSAIKFRTSVCIFSGVSGVGKSSLAASFIKKGFLFMADDISVIDHNLNVVPSFPNIKLWKDILKNLEIDEQSLSMIRPEIKKYHLPIDNQFFREPLPIDNVFILNTKNTPGFEFEELTGLQKFNAIYSNTYRFRFIEGLQKQVDHFKLLNSLLPNIKVYLVSRPQSPVLLNEFADYIIDTFKLNE